MSESKFQTTRTGLTLFHLQTFAAGYLGIWAISPPLAYGTSWRVLAVIAALLWVACEAIRSHGVIQRPTILVIVATAYVLYTFVVEIMVPDIREVTGFFQIWILCLFAVISESLRRRGSDAFMPYFYVVITLIPIWMSMTLFGYENIAADVSRAMSRSSDEARELSALGIGGFGFVYSLVLVLPIVAYLSFKWPAGPAMIGRRVGRRWLKWLVRVNFILALLVIMKAGYTIALLISMISLTVLGLFSGHEKNVIIKSLASALLLIIISISFANPVLDSIEGLVRGTEYQQKLEDIQYTLDYGNAAGTVEGRWERYTRSLSLTLGNILTGTLRFDDVGKHSSYLDTFAQYGIFIGVLFLTILLYRPYSYLKNDMVSKTLAVAVLFVVLLVPMLNPVSGAFGFMLFLFYPGGLVLIGKVKSNPQVYQHSIQGYPPQRRNDLR